MKKEKTTKEKISTKEMKKYIKTIPEQECTYYTSLGMEAYFYRINGEYYKRNGQKIVNKSSLRRIEEEVSGEAEKERTRREEAEKIRAEYDKKKYKREYEERLVQKEKLKLFFLEFPFCKSEEKYLRYFAEGDYVGFSHDNSSHSSGRGYQGYSESTNSMIAKKEGKFPKTIAAKMLCTTAKKIEDVLSVDEQHHTSKMYNLTDMYDIRVLYYMHHNMDAALDHYYEHATIEHGLDKEEIKELKHEHEAVFKCIR